MIEDYDSLRRKIGMMVGYGRSVSDWSSDAKKSQDVADILVSGLRSFIYPSPLPGERVPHEWSFLKPTTQLTLTSGTYQYDLPIDFSTFDGPLSYAPNVSTLYCPVVIVDENSVMQRQSVGTASGRPTMAAYRPKKLDQTSGTRYEVVFYPTPDQSYVLNYRYRIGVVDLSSSNKYPPGGEQHSDTVLEACLAAAERTLNDSEDLHSRRFMERLMASVWADRRCSRPQTLGPNRDRSDRPEADLIHPNGEYYVTYNGSVP